MIQSNGAGNFAVDIIRRIGATIDKVAFLLLELVYRLFFEVSTAEILSSSVVAQFYSRIQLIIGIFMLFQLAMTILKGIMNPDSFTDAKSGVGNVITRIITALLILTLLVPINMSNAQNEYEQQVSANGILFGTLYSLQNRILKGNTISKLIFGTERAGSTTGDVKTAARTFATTIIKGFYRINLKPGATSTSGKDPADTKGNRMCPNYDYSKYLRTDVGPGDITDMVNEKCGGNYAFAYTPVLSLIVGFVFAGLFLSFTIDVVVRTAKLAMLRLIAPVPVISYMNPNGSKDGAFNSWVKTLTSTYLDLFVRLATVYFVLFLIEGILTDSPFAFSDTSVGFWAKIVIFIGLLVFAKQAPKFFKQVLNIKDDGGRGFFSGMGEILAAGSIVSGAVGGSISSATAAMAKSEGNVGKKILSGFAAGVTGGFAGGASATRNFMTSKDMDYHSMYAKVRANNAKNYRNAEDDSTFFGRIKAGFQSNVGMKNEYQRFEDKIKDYGIATGAWKQISAALDSDDIDITYSGPTIKDSKGRDLLSTGQKTSTKKINDLLNRMKSSGQYSQEEQEQVEDARKAVQKIRFDDIRSRGKSGEELYGTEFQIYQNQQTFFTIGKKYQNDSDHVFQMFQSVSSVDDPSLSMGKDFKGAAFNASRQAEAIKSSPKYAAAKSDAERVSEQQKK